MSDDEQMKILKGFRDRIDTLDNRIVELLRERFDIVQQVGHLKARNGLVLVQTGRVIEVLERVRNLARENGLDPDFVASLYQTMIDHAHVLEGGIIKDHEK